MGQSFKGHHKSLSSKIKFIQCKESEKKVISDTFCAILNQIVLKMVITL